MSGQRYTIGLDFGTLSVRAVVMEVSGGAIVGMAEHPYAHGVMDSALPDGTPLPAGWALQHPQDYLDALYDIVPRSVQAADIPPQAVIGLGVDFTASTTLPVNAAWLPLCFLPEFEKRPHAYVKLWKHHGAQRQADRMTEIAAARGEAWLSTYGGRISCELALPKLLQLLEEDAPLYAATAEWVEACDWLLFHLTGQRVRSAGFAGYKSFYTAQGHPDEDYFAAVSADFRHVMREKYHAPLAAIGSCIGTLSAETADRLGLPSTVRVAAGNMDGQVCAPAADVGQAGTLMMIIGTSTGHHVLAEQADLRVPGMLGRMQDGMIPGLCSYELGQSCVGDLFGWFAAHCVPEAYQQEAARRGQSVQQYLTALAAQKRPGANGLVALDWWNGNRSVLMDSDLSGLLLGLTLQTRPEDIYRALLEATAYGTRVIVETCRQSGLAVNRLIASGGISRKNPLAMQIYADVLRLPIEVAGLEQGPAAGAAIWAAVAAGEVAGGYADVRQAMAKMRQPAAAVYQPQPENSAIYDQLYKEYVGLQQTFGARDSVMKRLLEIKRQAAKEG